MNKTKIKYAKTWDNYDGDLLVFILPPEPVFPKDMESIANIYSDLAELGDFQAKEGQSALIYTSQLENYSGGNARLLFVGMGDVHEDASLERDKIREIGGEIAKQAAKYKAREILVVAPEPDAGKLSEILEPTVEGILLGDYRFVKYKKPSKNPDKAPFAGIKNLCLYLPKNTHKGVAKAIDRAELGAICTIDARDMANEPGNGWTPTHFANYAKKLAKKSNLKCTVFGQKDLKNLGMGGIIAVNQGSYEAPKMVVLEHNPEKPRKTILMVGKGLTFDSGGVSLKPGAGMEEMKFDMCGGAAVISAMRAVAEEEPDVRVVAIVPATDNMAGGGAVKPGDVITHYGGITSEVINTDAEGRLILADALAYGVEQYEPDYVVDLATLTGAVIIGLGHHHTGLIANNDQLVEMVECAANKVGEPVWRLPLTDAYRKQIKSDVADIKNVGGRPAGTITAGAYLEKFIGKTPWVHFDIAGTAWNFTEKKYIPKGPSGTGSRTLIELIRIIG